MTNLETFNSYSALQDDDENDKEDQDVNSITDSVPGGAPLIQNTVNKKVKFNARSCACHPHVSVEPLYSDNCPPLPHPIKSRLHQGSLGNHLRPRVPLADPRASSCPL